MRTRVVFAASLVLALAVGMVMGLAAPRDAEVSQASPSTGADAEEALAQVALRDAWLDEVAAASIAGRLDGTSVAILIADGASPEDVDTVTAALESAGATVGLEASLSAEWWTPELAAYRGEIADQVSESVVGAEGFASTDLLQHAIVQALVPGAVPAGATAPGGVEGEFPGDGVAADRADVLLEVLTRSELVSVGQAGAGAVDALVVVAAEGPEGAGTMADLAASVWELYVPATVVVVFDGGASSSVAPEAIAHGTTLGVATRPSVVVATEQVLVAPQVVLALVEQLGGGTGSYGAVHDLDLIAQP
jgi:hypothetical protein